MEEAVLMNHRNILGISCFYHDAAAALIQDGMLIAAAEEERFSRIKHDSDFPESAIEFCLRKGKIRKEEIDLVVFYEKPFLKFERMLTMMMETYPRSCRIFRDSMIQWFGKKFWVKDRIQSSLGISDEKILFSEHHLSHAASAFLCSPFEEAAILTVDGVGEWATATFGRGTATFDGERENKIEIRKEIHFPHSLGLLYSAFTAFLGFEVNEGEYKIMGMSAYGSPRHAEDIYRVIRVVEDGSFWLDMDYFDFACQTERPFTRRFIQKFGEPRRPSDDFFLNGGRTERGRKNQRYADIAASIQKVTEEIMVHLAKVLYRETGLENLCLSGGVGYNGLANARILRETPFKSLYLHPAAGDSGGAVGAALWAYHILLQKPRIFIMDHCYWGESFSNEEISERLSSIGAAYQEINDEQRLLRQTAEGIASGEVIGWFQGRAEWGPRALGNRSILADPRNPEMKAIVNEKIKFREPFRPFAPSILDEKKNQFVSLPEGKESSATDFMLVIPTVVERKRVEIPAVTHEDGTARLQTVKEEKNPKYYHLIQEFEEITGIPVLLNTSFNLKGEPIVNTPEQAVNTFSKGGLDRLVLGNCVVSRKETR